VLRLGKKQNVVVTCMAGHGELAPVLYQQKKWGPLTSYCIADVRRHCMVFENIWEKGWVRTVAHGLKHLADPRARLKL
jgi:hypothetical protein